MNPFQLDFFPMLQDRKGCNLTIEIDQINKISDLLGLETCPLSDEAGKSKGLVIGDEDCTLIKGDNLIALGRLKEDYANTVDFCYIDPPYNTGSSFAYSDKRFSFKAGIWGRHAAWMSFMLPRLVLMRALLKDTGVAAISIDDYEYANLKILLDHVFDEENHLGTLIVHRSKNGKGSRSHVAISHEQVLLYGKTSKSKVLGLPELDADSYDKQDEYGRYKVDGLFRKKGEASRREDRPNMYFPLYYDDAGRVFTEKINSNLKESLPVDSKGVQRRWLWGREKATAESWKLYASQKGVIYVKNYLTSDKRVKLRSLWDSPRYLTERATNEITEIYGDKIFETPKPRGLIEDLIKSCAAKDSLILDYFCGTATTADAANTVNSEDGGQRKVILVEQSAPIGSDHIATSKGFGTIADIAEFRLKHIAAQHPEYKYRVVSL